nr:MAG: hypothetical protein [Apis mellifera filamentous virus]
MSKNGDAAGVGAPGTRADPLSPLTDDVSLALSEPAAVAPPPCLLVLRNRAKSPGVT